MEELIHRKRPRTILFYGTPIPFDARGAEVLYFENGQVKRFQALRSEAGRRKLWEGEVQSAH